MELEILRYEEKYTNAWETVVTNSINGTFLHSRKFYDHNPLNAKEDHSFLFIKRGKPICVIPCNLYQKDGQSILHSHQRSTYGGFVVTREVGVVEALEIVTLLIEHAKSIRVNEIIIRNPFRIFQSDLCDETDYAMWAKGFTIKSREIETAIQMSDYETVQRNYSDSTRGHIKKSYSTLTFQQSNDFEKFWQILTANLREKHGLQPTHTLAQFSDLIRCVGKEHVKLFSAEKDGQMVGGAVLFITNKVAAHVQYMASDAAFQEFRPLNGVIDEMVKWCCENGFTFLNFGTSNYDGGKGINEGLFHFKEGFGGRSVLRETMHIILV